MTNWLVAIALVALYVILSPPEPRNSTPLGCEEIVVPNRPEYICPDPEHFEAGPIVNTSLKLCRCVDGYRSDETSL